MRLRRGEVIGLVHAVSFLAVTSLFMPAAAAQGPIVQIEGGGGAIETAGAVVSIRGEASSIRVGGATIDIEAAVAGPVEAAAAQVTVGGSVGGELRAAGAFVDVSGRMDGNVYLAGAVVRFDARAGSNVNVGGATVTIGRNADIAGNLTAGGATVTVDATVAGSADISGSAVRFNGRTGATLTASGDRVVIGAGAIIGGDLVVQSGNPPVIAEGATITGQVRIEEPRQWWILPPWLWTVLVAIVMAAGAVLTGAILLVVGRSAFEEGLANAAFRPISSGLIGLAVVIGLPAVAFLLMTTIVGLSFGLALLLLLPLLVVAGHAVVAACIGVWIFDRTGPPRTPGRLLALLVPGAIAIAIVWLIPWVGAPVAFLAMLVGTGAYVRTLGARLRRPAPG